MEPEHRLSEAESAQICALKEHGHTADAIAREFHVARSTVYYHVQRHAETGEYSRRVMEQREYVISDSEAKYLVLQLKRCPQISFDELRVAIHSEVCNKTIRQAIERVSGIYLGLEPTTQHTDPLTRTKRIAWAKEHRYWTSEQWSKVLFTDERLFTLKAKACVRHMIWMNPDHTPLHRHSKGGKEAHPKSANFWGAFSGFGAGDIALAPTPFDAAVFIKSILEENASFGGAHPDCVFTMDTKLAKRGLQDQGVDVKQWPPHSPDLNPIQDLWAIVEKSSKARDCANDKELEQVLKAVWVDTKVTVWRNLISSMPSRCEAVINANGYPI
jgi:transposase